MMKIDFTLLHDVVQSLTSDFRLLPRAHAVHQTRVATWLKLKETCPLMSLNRQSGKRPQNGECAGDSSGGVLMALAFQSITYLVRNIACSSEFLFAHLLHHSRALCALAPYSIEPICLAAFFFPGFATERQTKRPPGVKLANPKPL